MVLKNKKNFLPAFLINEKIPFSSVLLLTETGKNIISKQEALQKAQETNLSLICVAPQADPPVCKLVDYQKFLFELNKKKLKKTNNINKEVRVSFSIEKNDLQIKLKRIQDWLEKGFSVKVSLVMKGPQKSQQNLAREKCSKIIEELKLHSTKIEVQGNIHSHAGSLYFFLSKKSN